MADPTSSAVWQALRGVLHPDLQESIVDLGLVVAAHVTSHRQAVVTVTHTTRHDPAAGEVEARIRQALLQIPGVNAAAVKVTWDEPWSPYRMADHLRADLGLPASEPPLPGTAGAGLSPWQRRLRRVWRRMKPPGSGR